MEFIVIFDFYDNVLGLAALALAHAFTGTGT